MQDKKNYLTPDGLEKIKEEIVNLKTVKRKEISQRIADAKELGDLSENAEYQDAKEEQGFMESRILELEQTVKTSELIHHTKNSDTVQIGSTVTITLKGGSAMTLTIVGSSEADPEQKKISNESPLGDALLGHKLGDAVTVMTPAGETVYTVDSIA